MGLFNLYKPKEYKYRYIYYDPKKEAQKEREQQLSNQEKAANDGEYRPTIHRGTFREMADRNKNARREQAQKSNMRLILILIILLVIAYFLMK